MSALTTAEWPVPKVSFLGGANGEEGADQYGPHRQLRRATPGPRSARPQPGARPEPALLQSRLRVDRRNQGSGPRPPGLPGGGSGRRVDPQGGAGPCTWGARAAEAASSAGWRGRVHHGDRLEPDLRRGDPREPQARTLKRPHRRGRACSSRGPPCAPRPASSGRCFRRRPGLSPAEGGGARQAPRGPRVRLRSALSFLCSRCHFGVSGWEAQPLSGPPRTRSMSLLALGLRPGPRPPSSPAPRPGPPAPSSQLGHQAGMPGGRSSRRGGGRRAAGTPLDRGRGPGALLACL